ncbi:Periostin [Choanephora cucurbitarum]|uniref:Periostin n=1 Tax=Choanephora cucurbitarum TaxID=101091 RepID=A0A1C7NDF4_9FUNG|nr:Periostin [Choanephora cucurbitarum]
MHLLKFISIALFGVSFTLGQDNNQQAPQGDSSKTITQLLTSDSSLNITGFLELITSDPGYAPIISLLNSTESNFTAFIPNNKAVRALSILYKSDARRQGNDDSGDYPPANYTLLNMTAAELVTYHVANGSYELTNFTWNSYPVPSLLNTPLDPSDNGLPILITNNATAEEITNSTWVEENQDDLIYRPGNGVNFARVLYKDIAASNGRVNIIDNLLYPPQSPTTVLSNIYATRTLFNVVRNFPDLVETLNNGTNFTLLAPNNEALRDVDFGSLDNDTIKNIILTHVIPGTYYSYNISQAAVQNQGNFTVNAANSTPLPIYVNGSNILINDTASVVRTDALFNNGVMHIIDQLLMPSA